MEIVLSDAERTELARLLRQSTLSQAVAKHLRVVLALGDGRSYSQVGA